MTPSAVNCSTKYTVLSHALHFCCVPANDAITPHPFLRTKNPRLRGKKKKKRKVQSLIFLLLLLLLSLHNRSNSSSNKTGERRDAYPAAAENAGHNLKNAEAPRHENR
jgi:hypothetical protein